MRPCPRFSIGCGVGIVSREMMSPNLRSYPLESQSTSTGRFCRRAVHTEEADSSLTGEDRGPIDFYRYMGQVRRGVGNAGVDALQQVDGIVAAQYGQYLTRESERTPLSGSV